MSECGGAAKAVARGCQLRELWRKGSLMGSNIDVYAPVLIPTLNRITHLRRCVESLELNTGAEFTEVYIAVDYPPSEEYRPGYEAVLEFLRLKQHSNRFKALHVLKHERNFGPAKNIDYLIDSVSVSYDRFIAAEDDNEFAPNFLEYINKGLELFEGDDRVVSICGCKEAQWHAGDSNVVALQLDAPYGFGSWVEKTDRLFKECRERLLAPEKLSKSDFDTLKKQDRTLFNHYILSVLLSNRQPFWDDGQLRCIDTVKSIYMHLSDKFSVAPMVGKSRTWGNDGTGQNMKAMPDLDPAKEWPLDQSESFCYIINGAAVAQPSEYRCESFGVLDENHQIESEYMKNARGLRMDVKADIGLLILRLCKFDIERARGIAAMMV